jgi:hypothetical protein
MLTPMLNYKEDHEIVKSNNEKVWYPYRKY